MKNFYFTFGSDPIYPYVYGYVLVQAKDLTMAINMFNAVFPKKTHYINCAFYYNEEDFKKTCMVNDKCHAVISFKEMD